MKRKVLLSSVVASTLTASSFMTSGAFAKSFAKRMLYREGIDRSEEGWYEELGAIKVKIKNHKNMFLQGYLVERQDAKRTVICLHALLKSSSSLLETAKFFMDLYDDANILLYDANAHGLSDGYIRGLGKKDVFDLMYFNTYLLQRYGDNHRIVMYGQGVGANTILNTAGLNKLKNVDLIISEGAYDNAYHYLIERCNEEMKIPNVLCGPAIRKVYLEELKVDIKKLDTVDALKNNTIPTVFVHSKNDKDSMFDMVFALYNNNSSEKFLFPIKDHYLYEMNQNTEYFHSFKEFLKNH